MSKGGGTDTTSKEPWSVAQPYIKQGYAEAENIYNQFTPQYYSGQTQASFAPDQLTAQAGIRDWATQGAPNIMNPALSAYQYGTGSNILDVANNPYVSGMANAAAQDAMSQLNPQLAGIRSGAIQSGGYGGGRQGIAEGLALGGAADAATRAAAGIYGNAYGQGLGHQASTLGQTGGLMTAGFAPYGVLGASGQQQAQREQALINDAQAKHQFEQGLPYDKLNQYTGALTGTSNLLGDSGITTSPGEAGYGKAGGWLDVASSLAKFGR